jgi:hypothetical protein
MVQFADQVLRAFSSQDGRMLWQTVVDKALLLSGVFSWEQSGASPERSTLVLLSLGLASLVAFSRRFRTPRGGVDRKVTLMVLA